MSLIEELAQRGITQEDLEKAASARLFEEACTAENIDLATLNEDEQQKLYEFWASGGEEPAKEAAAEVTKEAAAEAQVKLAEAEIIGRHMARAYIDELSKAAAGEWIPKAPGMKADKPGLVGETAARARKAAVSGDEAAAPAAKGLLARFKSLSGKQKAGLAAAAAVPIVAGGAYKMMKGKKKEPEKAASAEELSPFDQLALERANEILSQVKQADGGEITEEQLAQAVEERALEILAANGVEVESAE